MPIKLVTGPANAAKAGAVLGAYREFAADGRAPVLVVPTASDRDAYELELIGDDALIGGRVLTWEGLVGLLARRCGVGQRLIGPLRRRTLVRKAIEASRGQIGELERSAATAGFTSSLESVFRELGRAGIDSARLAQIEEELDHGRRDDLALLLHSYEAKLDDEGVADRERQALLVLDRLEDGHSGWDGRPVLAYGFSELTVVQRRVFVALADVCDVTISLPADGRLKVGLAEQTVKSLARGEAGGVLTESLPAQREASGPGILEGHLFAGSSRGAAAGAGDHVSVLVGSGTFAAAELIAAEVAERHAAGVALDQIAIVKPAGVRPEPIAAALADHGLESSWQSTVPLGATALGRALMGMLRCALDPDGATSADALAWMTVRCDSDGVRAAERIEGSVRVDGDRRASTFLSRWTKTMEIQPPMPDGLHPSIKPNLLAGEIKTAARDLLGRMIGANADQLRSDQAEQAAALSAVTIGTSDVAELYEPSAPEAMLEEFEALPVEVSAGQSRPETVLITDALSIRARSFDTVIVCGLEDGVFPTSFTPDPFLEDAAADGLGDREDRLTASEAHANSQREQFVICAARARDQLVLVRRATDDGGDELPRSPFVDEAMRLLGREFGASDKRRSAGDVEIAGSERGGLRAAAARNGGSIPPAVAERLGDQAARIVGASLDSVASPTRLEKYTQCPAKWLAEDVLNPADFDPKAEQLEFGTVVHNALEAGVRKAVCDQLGPISAANRDVVMAACDESLEASAAKAGTSVGARLRIERARKMVAEWLDFEIARDDGLRPLAVEVQFADTERADYPALDLGDGLKVTGIVDRVDVAVDQDGNKLIVIRDYKTGSSKSSSAYLNNAGNRVVSKWANDRLPVFQAPLYLKAASEVFDGQPGGAFYETLADNQRRGGVASGVADGDSTLKDRVALDQLEVLIEKSVDQAKDVVRQMVEGRVGPSDECDCPHPWLCGRRV